MTADYYQSFKYKAALVGNTADVAIIQIVLWKKHKNCYSIKVSKQLLKIPETIPAKVINNYTNTYDLISASFQGVRKLFVVGYAATDYNESAIKNNQKYFLPGAKIENYSVLFNGRHFYDQPVNDVMKQYAEVRKVKTG